MVGVPQHVKRIDLGNIVITIVVDDLGVLFEKSKEGVGIMRGERGENTKEREEG